MDKNFLKALGLVMLVSPILMNTVDARQSPSAQLAKQATQLQGTQKMPSGLEFKDIKVGTGETPQSGKTIVVHYIGTLKDGEKFDSSRDRKSPFSFTFGVGQVIKGWDEGLKTMRVGGRRTLIIPPALAYGEKGAGSAIPPNSTLVFDVELLEVEN